MSTSGKLYVFEGVDATGKSSICAKFLELIRESNPATCLLSFPGKTPGSIGELVNRVHHVPATLGLDSITPLSLQALHIAAHLDTIESSIVPALEAGKSIILDRFWWSTRCYGEVDGAHPHLLDKLIEAEIEAWGSWKPSALFYLTTRDPLRNEPIDKWAELKSSYEQLLHRETGKYPIHRIENDVSLEESLKFILKLLNK